MVAKFAGVAIGSGWQALVAYVNIGSYYLIGVPFGVLLAWGFHYGVLVSLQSAWMSNSMLFPHLFRLSILQGMWVGMISGTAVQTLILAYITLRRDWNAEVWFSSTTLTYQIILLDKIFEPSDDSAFLACLRGSVLQALKASSRMQRWSISK